MLLRFLLYVKGSDGMAPRKCGSIVAIIIKRLYLCRVLN